MASVNEALTRMAVFTATGASGAVMGPTLGMLKSWQNWERLVVVGVRGAVQVDAQAGVGKDGVAEDGDASGASADEHAVTGIMGRGRIEGDGIAGPGQRAADGVVAPQHLDAHANVRQA